MFLPSQFSGLRLPDIRLINMKKEQLNKARKNPNMTIDIENEIVDYLNNLKK